MDRLIDATGRPALGLFTEPVLDVNFPDFRYANPFGRPYGSLKKRFAFKQFQFLGAVSPGLVFGCAIVDVKFMSSAFVYFFDPRTGRRVGSSFQRPLWGAKFDRTPETGSASFTSGANSFLMEAAAGVRRLNVRLKNGTRVEAEFSEADQEPLRICTKAGYTGWVFVRKTAAMRTTGRVECALGTFDLGAIDALGHNDWSAGFMRRETFWNWASIGGRLADGRTLGHVYVPAARGEEGERNFVHRKLLLVERPADQDRPGELSLRPERRPQTLARALE